MLLRDTFEGEEVGRTRLHTIHTSLEIRRRIHKWRLLSRPDEAIPRYLSMNEVIYPLKFLS
jgi:hypothetical protein